MSQIYLSLGTGNSTEAYDPSITLDLSDLKSKDFYLNNFTISDPLTKIFILNLNDNTSFFVLQIHAYLGTVALSHTEKLEPLKHVNGSNIGIYWGKNMESVGRPITFYVRRLNPVQDAINIMLAVHTYEKSDPVPGGCNLSFEMENAPYQIVTYDHNLITSEAQPPSLYEYNKKCDENNITTELFYMQLPMDHINEDEYFNALKTMLTKEDILHYGTKVSNDLNHPQFKQFYNIYRGRGYVFGIVSTYKNRSSVYVPSISFGCDITDWDTNCVGYGGHQVWAITYSFLIISGITSVLSGHWFVKISIGFSWFNLGTVITFILFVLNYDKLTIEEKLIFSLVVGALLAIFIVFLHYKFERPKIYISISGLHMLSGGLLASVIAGIFHPLSNSTFWYVFGGVSLSSVLLLFIGFPVGHIISHTFVGGYALMSGIAMFNGGHIQYLYINVYRRLIADNYVSAVAGLSFTWSIFFEYIGWLVLIIVGFCLQFMMSRNRNLYRKGYASVHSIS